MCVRALSVGGRARAHAPACESAPTCVSLRASARPVRQSAKREGGARGLAQERPGERGVPACSDRRGTAAGTRTRARSKIKRTRRACVWAACSPPREQKSCGGNGKLPPQGQLLSVYQVAREPSDPQQPYHRDTGEFQTDTTNQLNLRPSEKPNPQIRKQSYASKDLK